MIRDVDFWSAVLASGVRLAVPTLLAALGELVAERAGVLNLGLEGMMVAAAFAAFAVGSSTGVAALGITAGVAAGIVVALLMVVVAVLGPGNQIVTGFSLTILGLGATNFLHDQLRGTFASVRPLPELAVPVLSDIPLVGRALFEQNILAYATAGLAVAVAVLMGRTRWGLEVTAVGHDPAATLAKGVRVQRVRVYATLFAGACAGLGGAALSIGALGSFGPGMTAGRGFVAVAVVILGRWRPGWTILGALIFGVTDALQLRLQNVVSVPVEILATLPWVIVLILLVAGARSTRMPRALGRDLGLVG